MRLGYALPSLGPLAGPESLVRIAQAAEASGYHSLWVADRLLYPVRPRSPYPATPDGHLPEYFKIALDPVESLTWVAAHTRRITLGTSVLNIPFYNPVVLGRRLATLDRLSAGRLRVGLGLAWSVDELEAVGADPKERGARAEEFIRVLEAVWGPDPVEFRGRYFTVAPSIIGAKPVQRPRPSLYLAAYAPAALRRTAALADGWIPSGAEGLAPMLQALRGHARAAGRDPARLEVILLEGVRVTPDALGAGRRLLQGSVAEVREDLARLAEMGVTELVAWTNAGTLDGALADLEGLRAAAPA